MKISDELLNRYINGESTDEEQRFVEAWMQSEEGLNSTLSEEEVSKMEKRIQERFEKTFPLVTSNSTSLTWVKPIKYAAAVALVLVLGITAYRTLKPLDSQQIETFVSWEGHTTKESKRGERPTVTLADGTIVHLNSESQLKFPEQFTETERVVYFEGHAHFDVARNEKKPFIIYTKTSKTQVLGTSFDIRTKAEYNEAEIIVTSGKVSFSDRGDTKNMAILTLDKRAVLNSGKAIQIADVDAEKLTAWKTSQLLFEKATLAEIIKVIEPWYNIQVNVVNSNLLSEKYRLQLDDPSLSAFMDYLSDLGDFEYEVKGNQVTIK
ncbi:MAG: FecR domain-containing protein [Bacteroidota bacterium]